MNIVKSDLINTMKDTNYKTHTANWKRQGLEKVIREYSYPNEKVNEHGSIL